MIALCSRTLGCYADHRASTGSDATAKGLSEASRAAIDNTAKIFPDFVFMIVMNPNRIKVALSYLSQHYAYIGETLVLY